METHRIYFGQVTFSTAFRFGVSLAIIGLLLDRCDGLRCMQCSKAPHFSHCEDIAICNATQLCYVEERIVYGQTLVYAGCKNKVDCDREGCFGEEKLRDRRDVTSGTRVYDGKEVKCHHCCDSDFCNMHGCPDSLDVSHLTGSRCFNCERISRPELCNTIKNCDSHHICVLEQFAYGDQTGYRLGCERKTLCDQLQSARLLQPPRRKRQVVPFRSECCSSHLCNGRDPTDASPPSPLSVNYQCPSPPPLTTTTTHKSTQTTQSTTLSTSTSTTTETNSVKLRTKVVPILGAECQDKSLCRLYSKETACSMKWRDWARENCPVMCNLCGLAEKLSTTISSNNSVGCMDLLDCTVYGKNYACVGEYMPWAKINCPAYCGLCQDSNAAVLAAKSHMDPTCLDKVDCSVYGKDYVCSDEFKEWAIDNCPKFCGLCGSDDSTKSVSSTPGHRAQTSVGRTVASFVGDTCIDKEDCSLYGKDYACSNEFRDWATINCPRYCGICDGTSTSGQRLSAAVVETVTDTSGTLCEDKTDCTIYGKDYACAGEFLQWATVNCPKYCGLCYGTSMTTLPTTTTVHSSHAVEITTEKTFSSCRDKLANCADYGYDYICTEEFRVWASDKCQAFCGYCSGD